MATYAIFLVKARALCQKMTLLKICCLFAPLFTIQHTSSVADRIPYFRSHRNLTVRFSREIAAEIAAVQNSGLFFRRYLDTCPYFCPIFSFSILLVLHFNFVQIFVINFQSFSMVLVQFYIFKYQSKKIHLVMFSTFTKIHNTHKFLFYIFKLNKY